MAIGTVPTSFPKSEFSGQNRPKKCSFLTDPVLSVKTHQLKYQAACREDPYLIVPLYMLTVVL